MSELNPHNPVAQAAHGKWHMICALVMHKCGVTHVEIKDEDVTAFLATHKNIGIADDKGYMEVFLMTEEETKAALAKHRKLPGNN